MARAPRESRPLFFETENAPNGETVFVTGKEGVLIVYVYCSGFVLVFEVVLKGFGSLLILWWFDGVFG